MTSIIKTKGGFSQDIIDALPDGIVVIDKSFNIISMNHAAETIFKISRGKATGMPTSTVLPEEMDEIAEKSIRDERTVFGDEVNPVLKGGEKVSIQVVSSPLFSDEGKALGAILQVKDLSSTKFLSEKNLQQSSASTVGGLLIGLAHELKNPLSGIKGAAQLLFQEETIEVTTRCADIIIKEVDRLCTLLERLGQIEPLPKEVFEPVDIHDILSEILFLESKSRDSKKVKFVENFDITLPTVLGNKDSLKQVFLNIIKNSAQAIANKGTVEISTRWITDYKLKGEKAISVEIRDTGSGISKEILQKISTPFYTTKKRGSGLGLFIAYQIIAKHGGAIFVESELEKGTVFKVYLPIYGNEGR